MLRCGKIFVIQKFCLQNAANSTGKTEFSLAKDVITIGKSPSRKGFVKRLKGG